MANIRGTEDATSTPIVMSEKNPSLNIGGSDKAIRGASELDTAPYGGLVGGRGSIMPIIQKLGFDIADLTQSVAKKRLLNENVIVKNVESMKKNVPPTSPKTPSFKAKNKHPRTPLPDWLVKWQNKAKENLHL